MSTTSFIQIIISLLIAIFAAISDLKTGKIPNKMLAFFTAISLPVQIVLIVMQKQRGGIFFANVLFSVIFAMAFYVLGYWAAGDSKMIMVISIAFPLSYYWDVGVEWFPSLSLFLFVIAVTYGFIICDTIVNTVLHAHDCLLTLRKTVTKKGLFVFIKRYFILVFISNMLLYFVCKPLELPYEVSLLFCFFLCVVIEKPVEYLSKAWWLFCAVDLILCFYMELSVGSQIINVLVITLIYLVSKFIQVFNYRFVHREDVCEGMIISALTIIELKQYQDCMFLEKKMDEGIGSRITEEEAAQIRNSDIDIVRVVRKLPMAVFVSVAMVLYLIVGMFYAG